MNRNLIVKGDVLIIEVAKEVDHHYSQEIRKRADILMECQGVVSVIFDFSKTCFMDSSGIGLVMGRYKKARISGGKVIITGLSSNIERIMKMSGVFKLVEKKADVESAFRHIHNLDADYSEK